MFFLVQKIFQVFSFAERSDQALERKKILKAQRVKHETVGLVRMDLNMQQIV